MKTVDEVVVALELRPHPEGGWFKETWRAPGRVETERGTRNHATGVLYLLGSGDESAWHRVHGSQELWIWQDGGELLLRTGGFAETPGAEGQYRLGPASAGHEPQVMIQAGQWQAARVAVGDWVLVSCIVSPGFDFADWEMPGATTE